MEPREVQPRKKAGPLQRLREDFRLAESMSYGRRLRGENLTHATDDELMAKVRLAYAQR